MKELNVRHQQRWFAAKNFFESMLETAKWHDALIMFDDAVVERSQVRVTDTQIMVVIGNCSWIMFDADPDLDAGLYTKTHDFFIEMRKRFKIIKSIQW